MSQQFNNSEEISLKELILLIKSHLSEILRYWWIVLLGGLLLGVPFGIKTTFDDTTYKAEFTFMLNGGEGNNRGGMFSLIGQLGGGGGGSGEGNNVDKMMALIKSRLIMTRVLSLKKNIDGVDDYYANHLMKIQEIEIFKDREQTKRFYFEDFNFDRFSKLENRTLLKCFSAIIKGQSSEPMFAISYDEFSGIFEMVVNSNSEELSAEILLDIFIIINEYYVTTAVEKNQKNYDLIANKADSLYALVSTKEFQLARTIDRKQRTSLAVSKIEQTRLSKDLSILNRQLGEAIKNKEMAQFSLMNKTPLIQEIDFPIYPLSVTRPQVIRNTILGLFVGAFLGVGFIVVRRIYLNAMAEEED